MNTRLLAALARIDGRVLAGVLVLVVCFVAFEGWHLVLRAPYAEYQRLRAAASVLVAARDSAASRRAGLSRLEDELKQVSERVETAVRRTASDTEMAAFLMAEVDGIASRHDVALVAMKPNGRRSIGELEEYVFEVSAEGRYLSLCRWLMDVKNIGPSLAVTDFEMKAAEAGGRVALQARLTLYGRAARGAAGT